MADNAELILQVHPVGGKEFSVWTADFAGEDEALEAISIAVDDGRGLRLNRARYDRQADVNPLYVNLTNVVSVQVARRDSAPTGQYV